MRELEREPPPYTPPCTRLAIIGQGRLGNAFSAGLRRSGLKVLGPLGRGANGTGADALLLCVPDGEIAAAAGAVAPGPLVGHSSGATGLDVLAPHEAFALHPLMTVTSGDAPFAGAAAAIAGSTPRALALAARLSEAMGMRPVQVGEPDRAIYHAAASVASNFLVTLEGAAETLAGIAGIEREMLLPLVRATVENWARIGAERALTGPIARGDEGTVTAQRAAIAERAPELLGLFDAMTLATRQLVHRRGQPA